MKFSAVIVTTIGLVLIGTAAVRASCIVAMLAADQLAIAADSMVLQGNRRLHECKIHRENGLFFATAGLLRKRETRFRLEPMARAACARGGGVDRAAEIFRDSVRAPLEHAMEYSRKHSPAIYRRDYKGRQSIVAVIFAGFEDGRPRLAMVSFGLDSSGKLVESSENLPNEAGSNVIQAGDIDAIRGYEHSHPDWALGGSPVELTNALVQIEARKNRSRVDGPISILKLDRSGAAWIERGVCGGKE